jgi:hypothetical protein
MAAEKTSKILGALAPEAPITIRDAIGRIFQLPA